MGKWIKELTREDEAPNEDHISVSDLARLAEGNVTEQERSLYFNHLNRCSACYEILETTLKDLSDQDVQEEGSIQQRRHAPSPKYWWKQPRYALAASLILCFMAGILYVEMNPKGSKPGQMQMAQLGDSVEEARQAAPSDGAPGPSESFRLRGPGQSSSDENMFTSKGDVEPPSQSTPSNTSKEPEEMKRPDSQLEQSIPSVSPETQDSEMPHGAGSGGSEKLEIAMTGNVNQKLRDFTSGKLTQPEMVEFLKGESSRQGLQLAANFTRVEVSWPKTQASSPEPSRPSSPEKRHRMYERDYNNNSHLSSNQRTLAYNNEPTYRGPGPSSSDHYTFAPKGNNEPPSRSFSQGAPQPQPYRGRVVIRVEDRTAFVTVINE